MLQLDPPIPMVEHATGRRCLAIMVIDYGVEHDLLWTVAFDDNGEIWCLNNSNVRMRQNVTLGRITT